MSEKWIGSFSNCELCGTDLRRGNRFYDCSVPRYSGKWGLICENCFEVYQCKLGTGRGQEYDVKTKVKLRG